MIDILSLNITPEGTNSGQEITFETVKSGDTVYQNIVLQSYGSAAHIGFGHMITSEKLRSWADSLEKWEKANKVDLN